MGASLLSHLLLFYLTIYVNNCTALPNPSPSSHVRLLSTHHESEDSAETSTNVVGVEARAASPIDTPTGTQQSQDMYSDAGTNGTTPQPGFIPNLSITREEVNCSDLSTGRDNKCWDELQLTTWVENWIVGNTCYQGEGFSSCFLRKIGYPELDCTGIKLATCTPPPVKDNMDTRVFYVAFNIYGTHVFSRGASAPQLRFSPSDQPILWVMVFCSGRCRYHRRTQRGCDCPINRSSL